MTVTAPVPLSSDLDDFLDGPLNDIVNNLGCKKLFRIQGQPEAPPGVHILAEFLVGSGENLSGIFIFSSQGILSGIEVYGLAGDAPQILPSPEELQPYQAGAQQ